MVVEVYGSQPRGNNHHIPRIAHSSAAFSFCIKLLFRIQFVGIASDNYDSRLRALQICLNFLTFLSFVFPLLRMIYQEVFPIYVDLVLVWAQGAKPTISPILNANSTTNEAPWVWDAALYLSLVMLEWCRRWWNTCQLFLLSFTPQKKLMTISLSSL